MESKILTESARNQLLVEALLAAGEATSRHYHRETEEVYFILSGAAEMELDGERWDVVSGDAVVIPVGAWHQIRADAHGLDLLCASAPPYRPEDTFYE